MTCINLKSVDYFDNYWLSDEPFIFGYLDTQLCQSVLVRSEDRPELRVRNSALSRLSLNLFYTVNALNSDKTET